MKAIFFDWDGTLVDSLPLLFSAHNHVRGNLGHPLWTREEYAKALVYSTRELYPTLYGEQAQEAQDMLYAFIKENHLKELKLLDGAEALMEFLHQQGVPMGLVSNKRDDVLKREVEHLGWQKYFGVYNGAGVAAQDKPSGVPLIYALGFHPVKLEISNILYVGDTESDLACAADAGCPVVFVRGHASRADELIEKYRPAYIVTNPAELQAAIMEFLAA